MGLTRGIIIVTPGPGDSFRKAKVCLPGRAPDRIRRFHQGLALVLLAAALGGCADAPPVVKPTPSTDVGKMEAWRDAELITGLSRDRFTLMGTGESMRPIYGDNTVLVIAKIDYNDLKAGMQVAYVTLAGMRVLHVLVEKDARGWRVQGLNNEGVDRERVTSANLIGVVYASFTTESGSP